MSEYWALSLFFNWSSCASASYSGHVTFRWRDFTHHILQHSNRVVSLTDCWLQLERCNKLLGILSELNDVSDYALQSLFLCHINNKVKCFSWQCWQTQLLCVLYLQYITQIEPSVPKRFRTWNCTPRHPSMTSNFNFTKAFASFISALEQLITIGNSKNDFLCSASLSQE